ncbi:MAG: hypothetical protein PHY71_04960 [Bacteroidaceae bacterium]|nr:hypothetical protein [Bacteroidaceae bacterium]
MQKSRKSKIAKRRLQEEQNAKRLIRILVGSLFFLGIVIILALALAK